MNIRKLKKYWHTVLPNTKMIPQRLIHFYMQDKKLAQKYLEGKITLGEYLYQRETSIKQITKLYGFTYNWVNGCVIGIGKKCFCFGTYIAKVPKRRIKCYCYITSSEKVVFNMKHNSDKFRFFGFVSIDEKDLMDE